MKITDVQFFVLKSEGLYNNPEGSEEPLGPTYMGVVKVSTDEGSAAIPTGELRECGQGVRGCAEVEPGSRAWSASTDWLR